MYDDKFVFVFVLFWAFLFLFVFASSSHVVKTELGHHDFLLNYFNQR